LGTTTRDLPKAERGPRARRRQAGKGAGGAEARSPDARAHGAARRAQEARRRSAARLWSAYLRGPSDQARNRLVEWYQPLAREIVRRFAGRLPRSVDRGDLETAASVGLMAAVEGFDPERGVPFESYCELRVRGALLDELRSQDWLPRPWRQRLEQHKRVCERLRGELGRTPGEDEIARALEMPLAEYRSAYAHAPSGAPAGSLAFDDAGEGGVPGLEIVADESGDAPGDKLSRDELLRLVSQKLTEQEYRIVYLKYWEELPMREIGLLTNLSESRVCKIHARLLERLKDRFRVGVEE
jgi:RNA polymerase sigma factor for flagellar operon FliA